jgi:hypothetical protein
MAGKTNLRTKKKIYIERKKFILKEKINRHPRPAASRVWNGKKRADQGG